MDQESIFCKARVAAQGLETLKAEHNRMIDNLKSDPQSSIPGLWKGYTIPRSKFEKSGNMYFS